MSYPPIVGIILMGAAIVIVGIFCIAYASISISRANSSQELELGVVEPVSTGTVVQGPEGEVPARTPQAGCRPGINNTRKDTPPPRPLSAVSTISSFGDREAIKAELAFTKAELASVKGEIAKLRSSEAELGSAAYDDGEELDPRPCPFIFDLGGTSKPVVDQGGRYSDHSARALERARVTEEEYLQRHIAAHRAEALDCLEGRGPTPFSFPN